MAFGWVSERFQWVLEKGGGGGGEGALMIIARSSQCWLKHFKLDKAIWTDCWCTSDTAFTKQIPALIFLWK